VLAALSPLYAFDFLIHQDFRVSFAILGAAFLAVTGGEAMYADMGHFGRVPIRLAWFAVALPALVLNYFGQAGLLITDPTAIDNPFYQLAPDWAQYPLVAIATLATVIASQAIISGRVFADPAVDPARLPAAHADHHTTSDAIGQIYVPLVNWLLAAATLGAVVGFGTSDALAGAYGIAVSLLMAITTLLAALVAIQWGYPPIIVIAVNGFFLVIDCIFFAANSTKLIEGGWFPLLLAGAVAFLMLTWRSGVKLVEKARGKLRQPEEDLIETAVTKCHARLSGTAVFLASAPNGVPLALTQFVKHNTLPAPALMLAARRSSRATGWWAWRSGARLFSHSCNTTPKAPRPSSACPRDRWWNLAPRSRFEELRGNVRPNNRSSFNGDRGWPCVMRPACGVTPQRLGSIRKGRLNDVSLTQQLAASALPAMWRDPSGHRIQRWKFRLKP
jgi:K+ transporter